MKPRHGWTAVVIVLMCALLQGCLYPKEQRKENLSSAKDGIVLVQHAVDDYQRKTGLLPLITADETVSRYEKFEIDFQELQAKDVLNTIPRDAFESGGMNRYLILDEETNPTVRVMDLKTAQRANDLERKIKQYQQQNGKLPLGERRYEGYYEIDLAAIKANEKPIRSPYSGEELSFMLNEQGQVFADYARDLMQAIEQSQIQPQETDEDLRPILIEQGLYSPVKSTAYRWIGEKPVPVP
ncbi:hypothetical protein [Paenibacillus aquistagni]|uniref:Uncharacterized protein n=1 Tax=Paenibacillus aquistagni TaxID=1852522 RepID=A0A1X7JGE0_9BACL|nr:hypothetical protein [Paenibacillus aquistagni]SMG27081.1 hypothetical protein SAMN06295960_1560 [Paenibacillus aquistagni]